jgi:hypothetical protein
MEHCIPGGERRGIWETLNHSAVAVEKLTLNARKAEGSQRGDVVRRHPIEHLILDDQAASSAA